MTQWAVYVEYDGDAEEVISALEDLRDRGVTVQWGEMTPYELDQILKEAKCS